MNATTTILSQLNTFQTLISGLISVLIAVVALFVKEHFDRKASKRNYIRDNGYAIHERLKDNLKKLLRSEPRGTFTSLPTKVSKDDEANVNMSFASYESRKKNDDIFSDINEVTLFQEEFESFEKDLLSDIKKVANLSIPSVQKIASSIEELYEQTKDEETVLSDLFHDEVGQRIYSIDHQLTGHEAGYGKYIQEAHKKIFWIKAQKLLSSLEKEIERVVKLRL